MFDINQLMQLLQNMQGGQGRMYAGGSSTFNEGTGGQPPGYLGPPAQSDRPQLPPRYLGPPSSSPQPPGYLGPPNRGGPDMPGFNQSPMAPPPMVAPPPVGPDGRMAYPQQGGGVRSLASVARPGLGLRSF